MDHIFLREVEFEVWQDLGSDVFSVELPCASNQAAVEAIRPMPGGLVHVLVRDIGQLHRYMDQGLWHLDPGFFVHRLVFVRRTHRETEIPRGAGKFVATVTMEVSRQPRYYVFHQRPEAAKPPGALAAPAGAKAASTDASQPDSPVAVPPPGRTSQSPHKHA